MDDSEERREERAPAPVIRLAGVTKVYRGNVRALDGLSADVPAGPVGLLGPNGAGKTTLIKLLLGLLEPDGGEALIAGLDPRRRTDRLEIRRRVGYMPESDCLLPGRTGIELVAMLGRISGLAAEDAMTRAHEMLDYVGLEDQRYRTLEQYSTGMKQRLKLAQALVHDPDLLLLDEPTAGMDPPGREGMLELVRDISRNKGIHVILSTHLLPDVEETCSHVVVLKDGAIADQRDVQREAIDRGVVYDLRGRGDLAALAAHLDQSGHHAEITERHGITYHNCGDWVESCTALAEDFNGRIEIIRWVELDHLHHRGDDKVIPIRAATA